MIKKGFQNDISDTLELAKTFSAFDWPRLFPSGHKNENPGQEFRTRLQENALLICPWGEKGAFASDNENIYKR